MSLSRKSLFPAVLMLVWPVIMHAVQSPRVGESTSAERQNRQTDGRRVETLGSANRDAQTEVAARVRRQLLLDSRIVADGISVEERSGAVVLTGTVNNYPAKLRANRIAESIRGVRRVENQLQVEQDEAMADDAADVVLNAMEIRGPEAFSNVQVTVDEGTVVLSGTVDDYKHRQRAERIVAGIRGVADIRNEIEVAGAVDSDRTDEEVRRQIANALRWDSLIAHTGINVQVNDGTALLSGEVSTAAERRRAIAKARIPGVANVEARALRVEADIPRSRLSDGKYEVDSPEDIAEAVEFAMFTDPRVESTGLEVAVADGHATLTGTADTPAARRAATQVAMNTVGVRRVTNHLIVEGGNTFDDQSLEKRVMLSLGTDEYIDADEIDIEAAGGVVTLAGSLESHFQIERAVDIAESVVGVVEVVDRMEKPGALDPNSYDPLLDDFYVYEDDWVSPERDEVAETDEEIEAAVEDQLIWDPYVNELNIDVEVERGVVTLVGKVTSNVERSRALKNAWQEGARRVVDQIEVE